VLFEWKLGNPYLLKNGSGDVFLDLRVNGKPLPDVKRKQMNLVLVIDRSGSMGSENKLVQVKNAAASIIENMNATDRLAVVIYDDTVQTLIPSSPVENKARLREIIYSLSPGGSTNLCGGMQQGFEEARKNFNRDYVNRIILLSDGLANAGITDPDQINAEAKRIRENFISVSTMGVGIDYNENLMANLADVSGGNYYYVSKEVNMAEVFRKEWNLMQNLIATNARATFQLGKNVDVVDVAGFQWEKKGTKLTIQVPDIYSGENKRILVQLHAPADALKVVPLGTGELAFMEVTGETAIPVNLTFAPSIRVVEDQNLVAKNFSREVQTKVSQVVASRRMQEAYRLLEEGKREDAYNVAYDAEQKLRSLGYVENKAQLNRYKSVLGMLSPATAALSEPDAKDMLKKQKEAERTEVQSEPQ
jgi:Ca-activated chloride channel family protein